MSLAWKKIAIYGGAALLLWLLRPRSAAADAGRVTRTIDIDANIDSPTFGQRMGDYGVNPAVDQNMYDLIERSNRAIAEDDAIRGVN